MITVTQVQAGMAAAARAQKAVTGAEPGPGTFTEPGTPPGPESFARPYLDTGHAAASPQHQAPNTAPLPAPAPGVLTPVQMPSAPVLAGHGGPMAQAMAAHQARAVQSMPPARGQ